FQGEGGQPLRPRHFGPLALALVDYRRGDFPKALARCQEALAAGRGTDSGGLALLAMTYHKLHREEEARDALARARDANSNSDVSAAEVTDGNRRFRDLFEGLQGLILTREASALIEATSNLADRDYTAAEFSLGLIYAKNWQADKS